MISFRMAMRSLAAPLAHMMVPLSAPRSMLGYSLFLQSQTRLFSSQYESPLSPSV